MGFSSNLERRLGWLALPGFLRCFVILHLLTSILQLSKPELGALLAFDREKILAGEVWRVATFPFAKPLIVNLQVLNVVFVAFLVMIMFMISDALDGAWGAFKTTTFYLFGLFLQAVVHSLVGTELPGTSLLLYGTAFFAFATLFPRAEFMVFFFLPVQVRFLAILSGLGLAYTAFQVTAQTGSPLVPLLYALTLGNYLLWAAIPAMRGRSGVIVPSSSGRSRKDGASSRKHPSSEAEAFHTCVICGRTDITDPELEFRVHSDGQEYCADHLPNP